MLGCICSNNGLLFRPGHVRKLPSFIAFRKFIVVGLKQNPWKYWISSFFVLSFVMITIAWCLTVLEMGISHRPSVLFLCPFKISVLTLRILISFLSNMATQSSSNSWPKVISEALCNLSEMCAFFAWSLRLISRGMLPVLVALIV